MTPENIDAIIGVACFLLFIVVLIGMALLAVHLENQHELKKLGILKPNNKVITVNPDYNEKLKYQIKSWLIIIVAITIICIISKLFGFSITDIVDLLK